MLDVADPAGLQRDLADQQQAPAAGLGEVGLQGLGAVRVVVLDGHPYPFPADRDLDRDLRREQGGVPHRVRHQFGDDQQQGVHEVPVGGHPLPAEQVPDRAAGLRNGFFYRGRGEAPHSLVREGVRRSLRLTPSAGGTFPLSSIFRPPVFTLDRLHASRLGNSLVRTGPLTRIQRQSDAF
ncbi:hypothetical protein GCM10020254_19710 [Streptomyces goshikiensis]